MSNHPHRCRAHARRAAGVFVIGLLLPLATQAATGVARLEELVRAGDAEAAYELAVELRDEHAGEVRFDLFYGIAALRTDHPSRAVFAFERVLIERPGNGQARLGLAQALFAQQQDLRAREQFEVLLAHDPPPAVLDIIERYLAAIDRRAARYRTTISGYVALGGGYDDNVNRAPAVDSIPLGFGVLVLGEDAKAQSDSYVRTAAGVRLDRPLVPGLNLVLGANGQARGYQDQSEFNTALGGARAGLRWIGGPHRLTGFLAARRFAVDGDGYRRTNGVALSYRYRLDDRTALHAVGRLRQLRYEDQEVLDSSIRVLGIGLSQFWPGAWRPRARLTVRFGDEIAEEDSEQARALATRDIVGFGMRLAFEPVADWTAVAALTYRASDYADNTFPFTEARSENYSNLRLTGYWQPSLHWRVGPYIGYTRNEANIALYDFERTVVGVDVRYAFF